MLSRLLTNDDAEPYPGYAPCQHCFESCGFVCEFGNDWNDGPYVHQTRIPCQRVRRHRIGRSEAYHDGRFGQ